MKTVILCSGGIDSVTLAHKIAAEHDLVRLLTFDYGQRHAKELEFAALTARRLGARHDVVDIRALAQFLSSSSLIDGAADAIPDGHYAEATMKSTIVPNRNAIMLTIAFGIASGMQAEAVGIAVHSGDHFIYPDCRPAFVDAFRVMQEKALEGMGNVALLAPFVHTSKAGIVTEGARLGVPFAETWSCYKGGDMHCGRCGTCVERAEAFHLAGIPDPTMYADRDYWKDAVKRRS
ncbi:7-cyano-7-deazaguanine synthase QueC [Ferrovibrio sp.]|uniref:7-cyano-7-deazaguanine synthase QueC n=1 Tax=Ferrovibrio sp. TaxID=1917215 RepID=UPI001B6EE161|nr:7-cyano-7-deazaguanine synthase QueC [Ferrovibrio sp.]MBP7063366.1 7-cyano-7-deazaguanine synthase QueC [Ferrovibrio sp.]